MKIVLKKNFIISILFCFSYGLYLSYNLLATSFYLKYIQDYRMLLIISVSGLLVFKEILNLKYNFRDLILFLMLSVISVYFYKYIGLTYSLLPFLIYSARNVNIKTILKISYGISFLMLIFIVMSSYLGWITYYVADGGGRVRDYLGFRYSLFAPSIFCNIIFLKIYLEKDNIKWITLVFFIIINYIIYAYTDSRLTFGLGMIMLILIVIIKISPGVKRILMNKLIIGLYVLSGILSIFFTIGYNHLSEWQSNANEFLGNRLLLGHRALENYGYGLFGKKLSFVGNGLDENGYYATGTYDYVDNLYIQLLLKLGIIFLIIFIISMTIVMIRIYRLRDVYLYIIFALLALHGIIDDLILLTEFNSFWFIIAALFYRHSLSEKN